MRKIINREKIEKINVNFIIFLDKKLKSKLKLNKSLFDLFKELYLFDTKFLINQKLINSENKAYSYNEISLLLLKDEKLKELYLKLDSDFLLHDDPLAIIKKNIYKNIDLYKFEVFPEDINLIPIDNNIKSNTTTIIIDGFADEKTKKEKKKISIAYLKMKID
jgi:hypothetical protein